MNQIACLPQLTRARHLGLAGEMMTLGARPPVVLKLLPLAKREVHHLFRTMFNETPRRGLFPSNPSWFTDTVRPSRVLHSAVFANLWYSVVGQAGEHLPAEHLTSAFRLYLGHCEAIGDEPLLSFDRAWTLVRFLQGRELVMVPCIQCNAHFVRFRGDLHIDYKCPFCRGLASLRSTKSLS